MHLIDGRYPSPSDRDSDDDGSDTPLPSKGDAFSRDGNDKDHFTVKMAPPAKRGRVSDGGKVPRQGRKKVIVESDDKDDDEVDDAFLADVDELLKGGNIDPLAFE